MGKNLSASGLTNVVQYNSQGDIFFVSGSTTLLSISSSGEVTTTGVISGSNVLTSSYSLNAEKLDNLDSTSFVFTSSFNPFSSSVSTRETNLESTASVLTTASSSFAVVSSSYASASGSLSTRVTKIEGNYATTGSNAFNGSQNITGSLTISQAVIAQTLNVQQVTSSIVYSCGSNTFGCALTDVQQFTGSLRVTGSSFTISGGNINAGNDNVLGRTTFCTLGTPQILSTKNGLVGLSINSESDSTHFGWRIANQTVIDGGFEIARSSITGSNNTFCNPYFVIKSDGTVGVNCLSPTATLTVGGTSRYGGEATFEAAMTGTSACFSSYVCSCTVNSNRLFVCGGSANNYIASTTNEVLRLQSFCPSGIYATFYSGSTAIGDLGTPGQIFASGTTTGFGINARGSANLEFGTLQSQRLVLFSTGEACFTGAVRVSCLVSVGTITGTSATFSENVTISKNQNALTRLIISNTTAGTGAYVETSYTSDSSAGAAAVGKYSSTTNAYKIVAASNTYLYNGTAGDIAILNDFASGAIKLAAGGSSSAHLTIASTGAATFSSTNITLQSSSEAEVRSLSTSTGNYANFIVDTDNTVNYRLQMVGFGTTAAGTLAGINRAGNGFVVKSGGLLAIGTRDANALVLSTNEAERMRITSCGTVKTQTSQAIGALDQSGTIANNNCVTLNLNSAGGNGSIGFVAIGASRTDTTACQAVRLFSNSHTNGANSYTSILGINDGGITITNNANGGETIYNCSGNTVNYVVRYVQTK